VAYGLTRIGRQFVVYFCRHRGKFAGKDGGASTRILRQNPRSRISEKNYMSYKHSGSYGFELQASGWLHRIVRLLIVQREMTQHSREANTLKPDRSEAALPKMTAISTASTNKPMNEPYRPAIGLGLASASEGSATSINMMIVTFRITCSSNEN
jgi:hypothetical protein